MRAFRRVPEGLACGLDDWERELLAQGEDAASEKETSASATTESGKTESE